MLMGEFDSPFQKSQVFQTFLFPFFGCFFRICQINPWKLAQSLWRALKTSMEEFHPFVLNSINIQMNAWLKQLKCLPILNGLWHNSRNFLVQNINQRRLDGSGYLFLVQFKELKAQIPTISLITKMKQKPIIHGVGFILYNLYPLSIQHISINL